MLAVADSRTQEQKKTHVWGVCARDNFMSNWGPAKGGYSRCCWATDDETKLPEIERMVKGRKEMRYVSIVNLKMYRPPKGYISLFHLRILKPMGFRLRYATTSHGASPLRSIGLLGISDSAMATLEKIAAITPTVGV